MKNLTIAEEWHKITGICFSIASHHCWIPDSYSSELTTSSSLHSNSYDGADDTFFILMQSDIKGTSTNLSSERSSVPWNPDTARRHSSRTLKFYINFITTQKRWKYHSSSNEMKSHIFSYEEWKNIYKTKKSKKINILMHRKEEYRSTSTREMKHHATWTM